MVMRFALLSTVCAFILMACSKDDKDSGKAPAASASSATPLATATAIPSATAVPTATVAAVPSAEPHHDCPAGSVGIGSFASPCEGKGKDHLMTVKWTKTDDKGPNFSIKNVGKLTILFGKIAVYFYDKSGKQLDVKDESAMPATVKPFHTCSGNFFQGVMKPAESATLTFSCVPKRIIPEGTASIEASMTQVGFADAAGTKVDFYWRNKDLSPDAKKKGK
jgi:hypothetical protein